MQMFNFIFILNLFKWDYNSELKTWFKIGPVKKEKPKIQYKLSGNIK